MWFVVYESRSFDVDDNGMAVFGSPIVHNGFVKTHPVLAFDHLNGQSENSVFTVLFYDKLPDEVAEKMKCNVMRGTCSMIEEIPNE